jgi:hypothetical protein
MIWRMAIEVHAPESTTHARESQYNNRGSVNWRKRQLVPSTLDLSERIEPAIVEAIASIARVAEDLNTPFFIVGVIARDFLLEYAWGKSAGSSTQDVNFGVHAQNWNEREQSCDEPGLRRETGRIFCENRETRLEVSRCPGG